MDFTTFADALPQVAWIADPDGLLHFCNKAWFAFTGLSKERSYDKDGWTAAVHPDDLGPLTAAWEKASRDRSPFMLEYRLLHGASGTYEWFSGHSMSLQDPGTKRIWWIGVATNIQNLRDARDERAEFAGFQRLANATPQVVWTALPDGYIDWYNDKWFDYTGQTFEEAKGWGWQAAHHPADFPEVMRRWPESIASGQPFEMEFRLRGADGKFRWFLTRVLPLRGSSGEIIRWVGTNTDIEEHKQQAARAAHIADTLQRAFLPKSLPQIGNVHIDTLYIAAESDALLGGDWFDVLDLSNGTMMFSIGDVAGHGLDAAIAMAHVRQSLATLAINDFDPARILEFANRTVLLQGGPMVTALVGFLHADTGVVRYCVAGHPPPMAVAKDGRATVLETGGVPLGTHENVGCKVQEYILEAGSTMLLYTDGIIEYGRDYIAGEQHLLTALRDCAGSSHGITEIIRQAVLGDSRPVDDVALLAITRLA
ncbi:MAG: SpoIIE family protein phosphatase [Candidatus Eremiobacteraeota bacterium]|nr:SpoIIE family protein phosphatase [Candidatus Eremiobacteraeota bacterium]